MPLGRADLIKEGQEREDIDMIQGIIIAWLEENGVDTGFTFECDLDG